MTMYILDAAVLIAAIYLLAIGIIMKKSGRIHKSVMGEELLKQCKDEKGFVDEIFPWMLVFSIVALLGAIAGLVLDFASGANWANYVTSIVFLAAFILFVIMYKRAVKKYFNAL